MLRGRPAKLCRPPAAAAERWRAIVQACCASERAYVVALRLAHVLQRAVGDHCEKTWSPSVLSFPYVCPEPVLVKR
jgi:hypothetical protein